MAMPDAVYMLSLDKRRSLWPVIEDSVRELFMMPVNKFIVGKGLEKDLHYNYIDTEDKTYLYKFIPNGSDHSIIGHGNAFLSHKEIFKRCLAEKYNNILFLEDDVYFPDRFSKIFFSAKVQNFLRSSLWDGIYLGWQAQMYPGDSDDLDLVECDWDINKTFDVKRVIPMYRSISGLHAILLSKKLIRILSEVQQGPMDTFLQMNMNWLKLFYLEPKVCGTLEGWSFCENKFQQRSRFV